jgi:acetate kinase
MRVLVINSGSSSLKYELFEMEPERSLARGEVERVEADEQGKAFASMLGALRESGFALDETAGAEAMAVGHRVVHGGDRFDRPTLIDDAVLEGIRRLALLAPLHVAANVAGIEAARALLPGVPQVAVFDTSFHRTMPQCAREYALPRRLAREHGIRRYGFHGTSHAYVARRAAALLGRPLASLDLITLHLGNGASATAIRGGMSVDTSMGMTPLEGLVMGTRSGDVDPAIPMLISELTGGARTDVNSLLNHESGLAGLCGESDMREVHRLADSGDPDARLALEMFCYRAKKYVGAYLAVLGRCDGLVFTAGIGENDPEVRARICSGLNGLGVELDEDRNRSAETGERIVSPDGAEVAVMVIPTEEEIEIARLTMKCLSGEGEGS